MRPHLCDPFDRRINYLRISVTDRCNFRCLYCMPETGIRWQPPEEILRYEEIVTVVKAAVGLGITKVRLTGGEPLVRADITKLVAALAAIPGIDDLSLTTNGSLLARYARSLKEAGLHRINVSLDTMDPQQFRRITRFGRLEDVLHGIAAAEEAGLEPIKVNTVVVRGFNDKEVADIAGLTLQHPWHVRFIELMPVGSEEGCLPGVCDGGSGGQAFVPVSEIRQRIQERWGELLPAGWPLAGNGPASYYRLAQARGSIGFISAVSEAFCEHCNRLRLTADGHLRPCLLADGEIDLKTPLRQGADQEELRRLIIQAVAAKPQRHRLREHPIPQGRSMAQIGG